jgi:hypothetical protein
MDQSLMQKLAISKQIMDKQDGIPNTGKELPNYNINESTVSQPNVNYNQPTVDPMSRQINEDSVMNSKLPDEIKKLMIENPIQKPDQGSVTLSNEIIEGAAALIRGNQKESKKIVESSQTISDLNLRDMVRDVVRDTVKEVIKEELSDKIILSEGKGDVKDKITFKVGNHIFQGMVTKVKKIS